MPATLDQDTETFLREHGIERPNAATYRDFRNHLAVNPHLRPSYRGLPAGQIPPPDYNSVEELAEQSLGRSDGDNNGRAGAPSRSSPPGASEPDTTSIVDTRDASSAGRSDGQPDQSVAAQDDVEAAITEPTLTIDPVTGDITDDRTGAVISYGSGGRAELDDLLGITQFPASGAIPANYGSPRPEQAIAYLHGGGYGQRFGASLDEVMQGQYISGDMMGNIARSAPAGSRSPIIDEIMSAYGPDEQTARIPPAEVLSTMPDIADPARAPIEDDVSSIDALLGIPQPRDLSAVIANGEPNDIVRALMSMNRQQAMEVLQNMYNDNPELYYRVFSAIQGQ